VDRGKRRARMVNAGFARLLANIMVMGTGVVGRAFMDAYRQALKSGGAAASKVATRGGGISTAEARSILNVQPTAKAADVREAFQRMHALNDPAKGGSAYLQAKVQNAHDHLVDTLEPPKAEAKGGDSGSAAK